MKLITLTLTLTLVAFTSTAGAGELVLHAGSWHSDKTYEYSGSQRSYNNLNLGVGYITESGWATGVYHNSYRKTSAYVARGWEWRAFGQSTVGVTLGAVTGYREITGYPVQPILALTAMVPVTKSVRLRLTGLPSVSEDTASVIHLSIGFRL